MQQTETGIFELTTNNIPMRIRTLQRLIKLYNEKLGEDYWMKIIQLLAPEIAD